MFEQLIAHGLNRAFSRAPGACAALAGQAGKTVALDLVLFRAHLLIEADGALRVTEGNAPDCIIYIDPNLVAQLPAKGKAAFREARTEGEADLLSAFNDAFQQLNLDAEAELASLFGPIIGFRLAEAGRAFSGWVQQAGNDTARAFAEYAVEESPLLAGKADIARFNREVDALRDDVARLEARLAKLEKSA